MSVEFEPVTLGQRRRRLDPVSIGAIAVAIALGAAVLKPWGAGESTAVVDQAAPTPTASLNLAGPHATTAAQAQPAAFAETPASSIWADLQSAVRRHEAWGVRAVVAQAKAADPANAGPRFAERWEAVPSLGGSVWPGDYRIPTVQVDPSDRSILALGVTFPPAHTPLDVRVWRVAADGLEWVDTEAVDTVPSGGAFLYVQPGAPGDPNRPWSGGTYRIDVLVDGAVRRVGVTIPDRFSNVPEPTRRPSLREAAPLGDPAEAAAPDLPIGLYATVDGAAVPLPSDEGPGLDEASAWLNLDPGTGRGPRSFVATAFLTRATGLGVMLPPGSVVQSAKVERLAPGPLPGVAPRVPTDAQAAHVLFRNPGGGAWTPGVYRLAVVWADADGLHDRSWHVELRPGPIRYFPRMLAAAQGWARYAGATGVILGTAEPLVGGPRSSVIRLLRLRPEIEAAYPAPTGVGCGGTVVDGRPGIIGLAYPADRYASRASARILLPFKRRANQVVFTAALGLRGLVLVAPARSPTLAAATWRFTVGAGRDAVVYALCLGMALFDD